MEPLVRISNTKHKVMPMVSSELVRRLLHGSQSSAANQAHILCSEHAFVSCPLIRRAMWPKKLIWFILIVLKRVYGTSQITANYSTTLSSLTFAGTVFGMLVFGYLSDKMGRKFGMVSARTTFAV